MARRPVPVSAAPFRAVPGRIMHPHAQGWIAANPAIVQGEGNVTGRVGPVTSVFLVEREDRQLTAEACVIMQGRIATHSAEAGLRIREACSKTDAGPATDA